MRLAVRRYPGNHFSIEQSRLKCPLYGQYGNGQTTTRYGRRMVKEMGEVDMGALAPSTAKASGGARQDASRSASVLLPTLSSQEQ